MNTLEGKKRIWYWDNLKLVLILSVVVGHFVEAIRGLGNENSYGLFLFIYSFHMPMFLFVSGLFYKKTKTLKKIFFYLAAGFLLKLLTYCNSLMHGEAPTFNPFAEGGAPWFMFALAWYTAAMWLLQKVDRRIVLAVAVVLPLITGNIECINDYFCASRSIVYFPFFFLGTMLEPNELAGRLQSCQKKLFIPAACVLLVWLVICCAFPDGIKLLHHLFTGKHPFSQEVQPIGFLYRILTDLLAVIFGIALMLLVPHGEIRPFSRMGSNTLNIYFWHSFFMKIFLTDFGLSKHHNGVIWVLIYCVIAFALTMVLSMRVFNFPLKFLQTLILNPQKITKQIKNKGDRN